MIKLNTALAKLLRMPLRAIPSHLRIPILGGALRGTKWIVGSGVHSYWIGNYEYEKQLRFWSALQPGSNVFDIGANVGFYTLIAALGVGPKGKVLAFEPCIENLHYLKKHVNLNGFSNVKILSVAVSNKSGKSHFMYSKHRAMGYLSADQGDCLVDVVVLDELVARGDIPNPDVIKIDVEGEELNVLKGATAILTTSMPKIFLATHGQDVHIQCIKLLESFGYRISPIPLDSELSASHELIAHLD